MSKSKEPYGMIKDLLFQMINSESSQVRGHSSKHEQSTRAEEEYYE
jgi:hypothetical protein